MPDPSTRTAEASEPPQPSGNRLERKRQRKIEQILAVTARSLRQRGYNSTSLDDIADELDLTKASLYHYFASKEELVLRCLEDCHGRVVGRLRAVGRSEESAVDRLRGLIDEQLHILHRDESELVSMFIYPWDWPPSVQERIGRWRAEHDEPFARVIDDGVASGELSVVDARTARLCLHGALNQTLLWFDRADTPGEDELDAVTDTVLRMFLPSGAYAPTRSDVPGK